MANAQGSVGLQAKKNPKAEAMGLRGSAYMRFWASRTALAASAVVNAIPAR
ncbi:hypothetical protein AFE_1309 [Acidithiobacillus ferrooxidans ATCC 23270]|uniref:Uncharacterized protein n=1 Tax=Acidithiobacillus ferrooxidans (strain ATCC 23270 / DSM 14882 / CIP 104768 / NCIMB 8455) TaxID=243159 RepID=B7J8Z1_ACIF2|nr:hypothetical protein AFE_1309 [Acidithiobacillus ferrooxidans ATCC 23270]